MDSVLFLGGCIGFAWLVFWSMRDFDKESKWFWPFDARWTRPSRKDDARRAAGRPSPPPSGWRGRL